MNTYSSRKSLQLTSLLKKHGIRNDQVLSAIEQIPRELFVTPALVHKAYENNALPIGQGQTISQPLTVATMTEQLINAPFEVRHVLEIGTGSGYQTAILATLFEHICSVERIKSLQFQAKRRLNQLNLHNVKMKHGDGWHGWQSKAPFDAIIVTAAASSLPQALVNQMKDNSMLILPIGENTQTLNIVQKIDGTLSQKSIGEAKFVPLVAGDLA